MLPANNFLNFLKIVFKIACISFGGPQSHYIILQKKFVEENNLISKQFFLELMSFCQLLPGPSSTQLITLISFQKWGVKKAFITLFIWSLPACFLMSIFSIFIPYLYKTNIINLTSLKFLIAFALGLLAYTTILYLKTYFKGWLNILTILIISILMFLFYNNPWIFPLSIILCIVIILCFNSNKNIKQNHLVKHKIKKRLFFVFIFIFFIAGFLSEKSRIENWKYKKPFNLFENTYRFGSTVFGGGNVLSVMMYEQYAVRKKTKYINKEQALIGVSISQVSPGPVFSYATYIGGLIFFKEGIKWQLMGCLIASIGIFLPGFLISIFAYQIWDNIKKFKIIQNSIVGIHLSVCAILLSSFSYLFFDNNFYNFKINLNLVYSIYIILIVYLLINKKVPIYILFLISILIGFLFNIFI